VSAVILFDAQTSWAVGGYFGVATDIDNLPVRYGDGVDLTVAGGEWVGSFLLPQLVALGRTHADSPAVATRPALPPQVPPWWFAKLPCGS
jgi:hypothetical protein